MFGARASALAGFVGARANIGFYNFVDPKAGGTLGGMGLGAFTWDLWTIRASVDGLAGFQQDSDPPQGLAGADVSGGLIWHLGDAHGPFIRGGVRTYYDSGTRYTASIFELPVASLGYQIHLAELWLDVGARVGPALQSRVQLARNRRDIPEVNSEIGAFATMVLGPGVLNMTYEHVRDRRVHQRVRGMLCVGHYIGGCFDASALWTTFPTGIADGGPQAIHPDAVTIGLSFVFGGAIAAVR